MAQSPNFQMANVTTGEKIVLGAAGCYFIWAIIPFWYSLQGSTRNGLSGLTLLAWLLAIVAIVEITLRRFFNVNIQMPVPPGLIHLIVAGVALLFTLLGFLVRPSLFIFKYGIGWGLLVALVIALAWAYGAYMMYSEPSTSNAPGADAQGRFSA